MRFQKELRIGSIAVTGLPHLVTLSLSDIRKHGPEMGASTLVLRPADLERFGLGDVAALPGRRLLLTLEHDASGVSTKLLPSVEFVRPFAFHHTEHVGTGSWNTYQAEFISTDEAGECWVEGRLGKRPLPLIHLFIAVVGETFEELKRLREATFWLTTELVGPQTNTRNAQ